MMNLGDWEVENQPNEHRIVLKYRGEVENVIYYVERDFKLAKDFIDLFQLVEKKIAEAEESRRDKILKQLAVEVDSCRRDKEKEMST